MTQLYDAALQVDKLVEKYGLQTFVETGCFEGQGLQYAQKLQLHNLYSCDINEKYVELCKQRVPTATIYHKESIEFLQTVLPTINEPTLFWLDAHYPTYYGTQEENVITKFPLVEEIKLIIQHKQNYIKDVIICDDLRVLDKHDNPYFYGSLDQYFYVQYKIEDLINLLRDTHDYVSVQAETGVISFTPK